MITERPWGYFAVLEDTSTHKVKRIVVYSGQRLSYQSHKHRSETWVFTKGQGVVTLDGQDLDIGSGSIIKIPSQTKHRIKNTGEGHLEFIEVQTGTYFGEDDIIRYSDDYGRVV